MTALCLAQCFVCIHAFMCGLCPVTVAVMLVFVCSGDNAVMNTDVLIHVCVCGGTVLVCSITKPSSTNPRFTPVRLRITVNLPPNEMTAGCTRDWWPCSRAKYSAQSALCHGIVRAS